MSYEKVKQARKTIIGMKQTVKAIKSDEVISIVIAKDTEEALIDPLIELVNRARIPVYYVDSRKKLGEAAGIDVKTSVVALTE